MDYCTGFLGTPYTLNSCFLLRGVGLRLSYTVLPPNIRHHGAAGATVNQVVLGSDGVKGLHVTPKQLQFMGYASETRGNYH